MPTPKKNSRPGKPRTRKQLDAAAQAEVDSALSRLSEHVTSVQIVGTVVRPDGQTVMFSKGSGDLAARFKAAEVFLDLNERTLYGR